MGVRWFLGRYLVLKVGGRGDGVAYPVDGEDEGFDKGI